MEIINTECSIKTEEPKLEGYQKYKELVKKRNGLKKNINSELTKLGMPQLNGDTNYKELIKELN